MGKNTINRNAICPKCDSGKKYKHCCGHHSKQPPRITKAQIQPHYDRFLAEQHRRQQQQGRGRPMITAKMNGQQVVFVGNTIYTSEKWKTPVDFLGDYIKRVFAREGADWGTKELKKPLEERHPILQWYHSLCELQQRSLDGTGDVQEYALTNAVTCYLGLAYNLYLLEHNAELQNIYVKRLKDTHNFQGAYYELMVAGCLIRAGFTLELEDETDEGSKHCEFCAISSKTGKKYWVEAKARSVSGVLGKTVNGTRKKDPTSRLSTHVGAAFEKPATDDRLIFVDVNTYFEGGTKPEWIDKANKKLDQMERDTPEEKKAYIFVTNMGFHIDPEGAKGSHGVMAYGFHIPDFSKPGYYRLSDIYKMKKKHRDAHEIMDSFQQYPAIPDTFDGKLPSVAYHKEEAPPVIGQSYTFQVGNGETITGIVTEGFVFEHEKKMNVFLDNGQMIGFDMSERLLQDYKKHPDTFFGVIHEQGKRFEEDDEYGFFERMVEIHLKYKREDLLRQMADWPNQDGLKALPHEELVLVRCEGIIVSMIQMRENRKQEE